LPTASPNEQIVALLPQASPSKKNPSFPQSRPGNFSPRSGPPPTDEALTTKFVAGQALTQRLCLSFGPINAVIKALNSGELFPRKRPCGYGKTTHAEICRWAGIDSKALYKSRLQVANKKKSL
jgi:hypothetical protein